MNEITGAIQAMDMEETYHAWYGIAYYTDSAADRRTAQLGLQPGMGVRSIGRSRTCSCHCPHFVIDGADLIRGSMFKLHNTRELTP